MSDLVKFLASLLTGDTRDAEGSYSHSFTAPNPQPKVTVTFCGHENDERDSKCEKCGYEPVSLDNSRWEIRWGDGP